MSSIQTQATDHSYSAVIATSSQPAKAASSKIKVIVLNQALN
jgi:hypothetical protein